MNPSHAIRAPLLASNAFAEEQESGCASNRCRAIWKSICCAFSRCRSRPVSPRASLINPQLSEPLNLPQKKTDAASLDLAPDSPIQTFSHQVSKVSLTVCKVFNHRIVLGSIFLGSAASVAVSAINLSPVFADVSNTCLNELNGLTDGLPACEMPFQSSISRNQLNIALSCLVMGSILQKLWEPRPETFNQNEQLDRARVTPEVLERMKKWIAYIQNGCSYELHLGLGYLYGGLWLDTSTPESWISYYKCGAAGIGIAGCFLGMYARVQWVATREFLSLKSKSPVAVDQSGFQLKKHIKKIALSLLSGGMVFWGSTSHSTANRTVQEIGMMLLARPLGQMVTLWVNKQQSDDEQSWKTRVASVASSCLGAIQAPLVVLGFYIYLKSPDYAHRLSGMGVVGFAEGVKDVFYTPLLESPQQAVEEGKGNRCAQLMRKVYTFTRDYWKTGALITFAITSAKIEFLKCYNVNTFDCPISFELSGDYVNIDGVGVNIAIAAGLTTYYARRIFKVIQYRTSGRIQQIPKLALHVLDKYQFDLLSLIPYAIIHSGKYIPAYYDFATYNPKATLVLIGMTMGNYKEKVHSQGPNDPYRPLFADVSILSPLI